LRERCATRKSIVFVPLFRPRSGWPDPHARCDALRLPGLVPPDEAASLAQPKREKSLFLASYRIRLRSRNLSRDSRRAEGTGIGLGGASVRLWWIANTASRPASCRPATAGNCSHGEADDMRRASCRQWSGMLEFDSDPNSYSPSLFQFLFLTPILILCRMGEQVANHDEDPYARDWKGE
jgi:hypothetical protein